MSFDFRSLDVSSAARSSAALACTLWLATAPAAAQDVADESDGQAVAEVEVASSPEPLPTTAVLASNDAPASREHGMTSTPPAAPAEAPADEGPRTAFSLSLNQDIFFGFYGTAAGTVELAPGIALSAYTILWTTPSFAAGGGGGGGGLWTEFGVGVFFDLLEGRLNINPQIGILNGVLLSGSPRGLAFEGIVPNLTANYRDDLLQGQVYFGYYLGLREQRPNDFVHYWVNAGVRATSFLAFGAHWEHLVHSRGAAEGANENLYMWIGPYAELGLGPFALRFTAGVDVADPDVQLRDFYKVNVVASF